MKKKNVSIKELAKNCYRIVIQILFLFSLTYQQQSNLITMDQITLFYFFLNIARLFFFFRKFD